MRLRFLILTMLLFSNYSYAKVLINLYNQTSRSTIKAMDIISIKSNNSKIEMHLKSAHLGCHKINIEKNLIENTRVDHLFIEHAAVINGTVASSIDDFEKFITKNQAGKQTVMVDLTMTANECITNAIRVRVL